MYILLSVKERYGINEEQEKSTLIFFRNNGNRRNVVSNKISGTCGGDRSTRIL